jgi:DNA-binding LacI/PurR family transcriptional regulator
MNIFEEVTIFSLTTLSWLVKIIPTMSLTVSPVSSVETLAKRLEVEIRSQGLRAGEAFYSAAEAGNRLGVSPATANRALNELVRRGVLIRQHGRGTFIGAAVGEPPTARVRTVFVLMEESQRGLTSVRLQDMLDALGASFQDANVQFCFVPSENAVSHVREVIENARKSRHFAGALPISCSREIYRYLSGVGGPVVVLGSLFADQQQLPSIDVDYQQGGRLLASHLFARKHRRIALFTTGHGRPGDHAFFDGISEAMTQAGLPPNALTLRIFSPDFDLFNAQLADLMCSDAPPTGIICASDKLLSHVVRGFQNLEPEASKRVELTYLSEARADAPTGYAHAQPQLSFRQIADRAVSMLKEQSQNQKLSEPRVVIPLELCSPE